MTVSFQIRTRIVCASCLDNEGRYITRYADTTHLVCGFCTVKHQFDAIKIDDVPALLDWCRAVLSGGTCGGSMFQRLREIVGINLRAEGPRS